MPVTLLIVSTPAASIAVPSLAAEGSTKPSFAPTVNVALPPDTTVAVPPPVPFSTVTVPV